MKSFMRKSLSFLLSAISLTSVCRSYFAEVNSEPVGTAGGFSENFEWSIDDEGVLTIRGEGNMPSYEEYANAERGATGSVTKTLIVASTASNPYQNSNIRFTLEKSFNSYIIRCLLKSRFVYSFDISTAVSACIETTRRISKSEFRVSIQVWLLRPPSRPFPESPLYGIRAVRVRSQAQSTDRSCPHRSL